MVGVGEAASAAGVGAVVGVGDGAAVGSSVGVAGGAVAGTAVGVAEGTVVRVGAAAVAVAARVATSGPGRRVAVASPAAGAAAVGTAAVEASVVARSTSVNAGGVGGVAGSAVRPRHHNPSNSPFPKIERASNNPATCCLVIWFCPCSHARGDPSNCGGVLYLFVGRCKVPFSLSYRGMASRKRRSRKEELTQSCKGSKERQEEARA